MTEGVIIELAPLEGLHLRGLVDEFLALLAADGESEDPALERLAPTAYPDDAAAAADYRTSTRGELMERRERDARRMRAALAHFAVEVDPASRDAVAPHPLTVSLADMDAWMRTFAAMRLVIATRLGVDVADEHDFNDPRFHVYDWLGYRLDELIRLADEHDAMAS